MLQFYSSAHEFNGVTALLADDDEIWKVLLFSSTQISKFITQDRKDKNICLIH